MSKHTPLPWTLALEIDGLHSGWKTWIKGQTSGVAVCNNQTRRGVFRAKQNEAEANAQLIVTAVNNHARLVDLVGHMCKYPDDEHARKAARTLLAKLDGELE